MALLRVGPLPGDALAASAQFHARTLPRVREALETLRDGEVLTLVFTPASYEHRGWRRAVVQGLAREHAPRRVNGVESEDEATIAAAAYYLDAAPGVTGQLLPLDGNGAGQVLSCQP